MEVKLTVEIRTNFFVNERMYTLFHSPPPLSPRSARASRIELSAPKRMMSYAPFSPFIRPGSGEEGNGTEAEDGIIFLIKYGGFKK